LSRAFGAISIKVQADQGKSNKIKAAGLDQLTA
jgi:hypothetical protein